MAIGVKTLGKIALGRELTSGTQVATANLWRGMGVWKNPTEPTYPEEQIGIVGGTDRSYIPLFTTEIELSETPATYEQLPYLLLGMGLSNTGAADGSGSSGYKYITTIPTTSLGTPTTMTAEFGDNAFEQYCTYLYPKEVVLSGTMGSAITMKATMGGRRTKDLSAFSYPLTLPNVEEIMFGRGKLYLDAVGGTIGTTQVSNAFCGFGITIKPILVEKPWGDGRTDLDFSGLVFTGFEISGKVTLERDTQVNPTNGELYNFDNRVSRLMRIQIEGSAYTTPGSGTLFSGKKGIRIDLPVSWSKVSDPEDTDGNMMQTLEFTSKYNTTYGGRGAITIANQDATLLP